VLEIADSVFAVSNMMSPKLRGIPEAVEQPDRTVESSGTEVHVPLRRREILMARELLNRAGRRAPHREMRTEGVPQSVHAVLCNLRASRRAFHTVLDDVRRHRRAIRLTQHALRSQVPVVSKCRGQSNRERELSHESIDCGDQPILRFVR